MQHLSTDLIAVPHHSNNVHPFPTTPPHPSTVGSSSAAATPAAGALNISNLSGAVPTTSVESRMRKSSVSFTATFVGISGYPSSVGSFVSSPVVELEERMWSVKVFMGGKDEDSQNFISCYIAYESRGKVRASYRLSIHNQMGWKNHSVSSDGAKNFCNNPEANETSMWGENRFIARDALRHSSTGHCVDDTLVIQVDLTIYGEMEHSFISAPVKSTPLQQRGRTLLDDFQRLCFDPTIADISFHVEGEVIPAHKFLLCVRSDVFRAMLASSMSESITHEIVITDFSAVAVKEMIRFIYTDHCDVEILQRHAQELLAIACKYNLSGLLNLCEKHLCATINVQNVAHILHTADIYQAKQLKERALLFISQNVKSVIQTEGFFENLGFQLTQDVVKILSGMDPMMIMGD